MAPASTWSDKCWWLENMQRKDGNDRVDTYDTCSGLLLGQGTGLGEPLVWPYKAELRRMNTTCLLPSKYLHSCSNKVIKPSKSKATSERGLVLPLTGAGTTALPAPVLETLGWPERESLSVPVRSGKFWGFICLFAWFGLFCSVGWLFGFFSVSSTCPGMWGMSLCGFPPLAAGQSRRDSHWSVARTERICNRFPESLAAVGWAPLQQLHENHKIKAETWSSWYVQKVAIGISSRRVMDLHRLEPATPPSGNSSPLGKGLQSTLVRFKSFE